MIKNVTEKFIKKKFKNIINVGYNAKHLIEYLNPTYKIFVNDQNYGNVYKFTNDTCIISGLLSIGIMNYVVTKKWDDKAKEIGYDNSIDWLEKYGRIMILLQKCVSEMLKKR